MAKSILERPGFSKARRQGHRGRGSSAGSEGYSDLSLWFSDTVWWLLSVQELDPPLPKFLGSGRWWGCGLCPGPGGDWGTHRPSKRPVPPSQPSPQLLPETHSGTPSSVQGCAQPRWGRLPKQSSQAIPLVRSPLQGALKVFI